MRNFTKTANNWKIFFDSMNSKKNNLLQFVPFMIFGIIYLFLFSLDVNNGINFFKWLYAILWFMLGFVVFMRLFYNQTSLRFSKTIPAAKKLYTKYIWICFQVVSYIPVLEWIIIWLIFGLQGKNTQLFPIVLMFICLSHLLISVMIPFSSILLSKEKKVTSNNMQNLGTMGKLLLFILLMTALIFGILYQGLKKVIEIWGTSLYDKQIILLIISGIILAISIIANRLMINYLYKSRG